MKAKNARRVMARFGEVEVTHGRWGERYVVRGVPPWTVEVDVSDAHVCLVHSMHGSEAVGGWGTTLNGAIRNAFERRRYCLFAYMDKPLVWDGHVLYVGAHLRETAGFQCCCLATLDGQTAAFAQYLDVRTPQGREVVKEVCDGLDPGVLLDYMQEHEFSPDVGRLIDDIRRLA